MSERVTADDLRMFEELKAKIKAGKKAAEESSKELFNAIANSTDFDKAFELITMAGGKGIKRDITLDDGRVLAVVLKPGKAKDDSDE